EMFDSASSFSALVGIAVDVVNLFMALLSFVESAPRSLSAQGGQRRFSYFNIVRDNSECRCGEEMKLARTERLPDQTGAHIRIYTCRICGKEMRLRVGVDDLLA